MLLNSQKIHNMNLIAFVIVAFLNFGCNNNNELVSKFEKKEFPVYLNT
jgi:hypothetical protein